jgi:hypothetical protein
MALYTLVGTLVALAVVYLLKQLLLSKPPTAPLPPGPKPKPIVGNLGDLPPPGQQEWKHWLQFKKLYGACIGIPLQNYSSAVTDKCLLRRPHQLYHYFWPDNCHHQ